jgi:hypothetical protein
MRKHNFCFQRTNFPNLEYSFSFLNEVITIVIKDNFKKWYNYKTLCLKNIEDEYRIKGCSIYVDRKKKIKSSKYCKYPSTLNKSNHYQLEMLQNYKHMVNTCIRVHVSVHS